MEVLKQDSLRDGFVGYDPILNLSLASLFDETIDVLVVLGRDSR